eukprot:6504864-Alexandrium_andersonii.AAC.1
MCRCKFGPENENCECKFYCRTLGNGDVGDQPKTGAEGAVDRPIDVDMRNLEGLTTLIKKARTQ